MKAQTPFGIGTHNGLLRHALYPLLLQHFLVSTLLTLTTQITASWGDHSTPASSPQPQPHKCILFQCGKSLFTIRIVKTRTKKNPCLKNQCYDGRYWIKEATRFEPGNSFKGAENGSWWYWYTVFPLYLLPTLLFGSQILSTSNLPFLKLYCKA